VILKLSRSEGFERSSNSIEDKFWEILKLSRSENFRDLQTQYKMRKLLAIVIPMKKIEATTIDE